MKFSNIFILGFLTLNTYAATQEIKEVFVAKAKKTILTEESIYPGVVQSRVYSQIAPQINSIVEKILIPLGSKVAKGDRILKISNQDSSLNFKASYIEAPVSGVVSWYGVREGSFLKIGETAVIVTDPNKLYIKLEIPTKDLAKIKFEQKGDFYIESYADKFKLKVAGIGSLVDIATGTISVELDIDQKNVQGLYPGQIGKVNFKFHSEPLYLVKDSAVKMIGAETFIQIIEDGAIKKIKVELGQKSNGQSVVLTGLVDDLTYVEQSSGHLSDGDKVKIAKKL